MTRIVTRQDIERALGAFDELQEIGLPSGSGECWRARRGPDDFALKVIVREHEPGRFQREVEALKRLDSDRVMRVHADGDLSTQAGGSFPFLLSEYVPGGDLRSHISRTPTISELRAFLKETFSGLAELHAAEVVHRDLKPENIILRHGDWAQPVLIDLGLSRLVDSASFTVYPWAWGTWPYMAPEQLAAERALDRTDVWAVGVVAAELALGRHPFKKPTDKAMPSDWDDRLRAGIAIPGSQPAALHQLIENSTEYRAYRRPTAEGAVQMIERNWV